MADPQNKRGAATTLNLLEALTGFAASGASNADLAAAIGRSPSVVTQAMVALTDKGWARKDPMDGRFYPTAAFTRLAFRVLADFDRLQTQLDDRRAAMTRS